VILEVETDYPWQGQVILTIKQTDDQPWRLALRVPGWCDEAAMRVEGQPVKVPSRGGYVVVERTWRVGDTVELEFPMTPRLVEPHPQVDAARGCVAIQCGPVVYCIEQIDQEPSVDILGVQIDGTLPLRTAWRGDLLGGVMTVEARGCTVDIDKWGDQLYRPVEDRENLPREPVRLTAVPYYAWANREPGPMRVWIPKTGGAGCVRSTG
jgi:DUF1680 family protein